METKLDVNVYKFIHEIKKDDLYIINPSSSTAKNLNTTADIIFESSGTNNPVDICNSFIRYEIEISNIKADDNVTLEHNFFPNLFNSMRLALGSSEIENIENPGEISSMLNYILLDKSNEEIGEVIGWMPDKIKEDPAKDNKGYKRRKQFYNNKNNTDTSFVFKGIFPLKQLFGFLESYNRLLILMYLKLTLNRKIEDARLFYGTKGEPKLTCKSLEFCMPELTLNPQSELDLLERIKTDKPVTVNFLNRLSNVIDIPEGSTFSWNLALLKNKPRFIIVGFKDSEIKYTINNSKFIQSKADNNRIKSLRIRVNNFNYPMNKMRFDISRNDQVEPYLAYVSLCKNYLNRPQLNMMEFQKLYSIFCFDISAQDEKLIVNGCNVTLDIEKDSAFKCKAYCCILEERTVEILLRGGKMYSISDV